MTDHHANPPRLKDRHDQPDLVERIAGQAARDLPEPPPLSASTLARIVQRIEQNGKPRTLRLGRVLVAASLLLGMVTVASAARMDLMPRWMTKMVGGGNEWTEPTAHGPAKTRSAKKPSRTSPLPAVHATKEQAHTEVPAQAAEKTAASPLPANPTPSPLPAGTVTQRKKLALVTPRTERADRAPDPERTTIGQEQAPPFPSPSPPPSPALQARSSTPVLLLAPPSERPVPPVPQVPAPAPAPPSSVERPAPATPASPTPAPAPPAAATTGNPAARHLKDIVRALRVERAPRTALELLDRHADELKSGAFAEEALLLRVEAMLALRQHPDALRLLDGMSLAHAASSNVLLVTRAQLRANVNRCAEAVTDFDLALARTLRPSQQALLGRARCKQKLGDTKAAQADMDRLQQEFPAQSGP